MLLCVCNASTASAIITDVMLTVTVTVPDLVCEQMYTIVAGGINIVDEERVLDGPRLRGMEYSASACPVMQVASTSIGECMQCFFIIVLA